MRLFEPLIGVGIIGVFVWELAHRAHYHISRFGFYYGIVAIIALAVVYAWAWFEGRSS